MATQSTEHQTLRAMNSGILEGARTSRVGLGEAWDCRTPNISFELNGVAFKPKCPFLTRSETQYKLLYPYALWHPLMHMPE